MLKHKIKQMMPQSMWSFFRSKWHLVRRTRAQLRHFVLWKSRKQVSFERSETTINLCIVDPQDLIQRYQSRKGFYEEQELDSIAPFFKTGGVFVDIGANTGQHSIYFAKLRGASKLILFEPVPFTCRIATENIRLNNLEAIADLSNLGFGVSDKSSRANFSIRNIKNLGGAELLEDSNGALQTITGDSVLADQHVDFIKIDTEGFEIKVLKGLERTISESRPTIFVEVDNDNLPAFETFIKETDYKIVQRHKRYPQNENFLIVPQTEH
jgi:FkbM family methyltransferase